MNYEVGQIVEIYDEHEDDWFEGKILEPEEDEAWVEYETTHFYRVSIVKYKFIRPV